MRNNRNRSRSSRRRRQRKIRGGGVFDTLKGWVGMKTKGRRRRSTAGRCCSNRKH